MQECSLYRISRGASTALKERRAEWGLPSHRRAKFPTRVRDERGELRSFCGRLVCRECLSDVLEILPLAHLAPVPRGREQCDSSAVFMLWPSGVFHGQKSRSSSITAECGDIAVSTEI